MKYALTLALALLIGKAAAFWQYGHLFGKI